MTTWSDVFAFFWHELTVPRFSYLYVAGWFLTYALLRAGWDWVRENWS